MQLTAFSRSLDTKSRCSSHDHQLIYSVFSFNGGCITIFRRKYCVIHETAYKLIDGVEAGSSPATSYFLQHRFSLWLAALITLFAWSRWTGYQGVSFHARLSVRHTHRAIAITHHSTTDLSFPGTDTWFGKLFMVRCAFVCLAGRECTMGITLTIMTGYKKIMIIILCSN